MIAALLTAAGIGQRMHLETPKQFLRVRGKPILVHTLERFERHPDVDAILVVTLPDQIDEVRGYTTKFGMTKLRWIVAGGDTGQDSIRNGLTELTHHLESDDIVLVHDGNRPMVSPDIISDAIRSCRLFGSGVPAIPCVEVTYLCDDLSLSGEPLPRERLRRTQTPHAYPLSTLVNAHKEAAVRGITGTAASVELLQRLGIPSRFSLGSETNLKITTRDDLAIFRALLAVEQNPAIED